MEDVFKSLVISMVIGVALALGMVLLCTGCDTYAGPDELIEDVTGCESMDCETGRQCGDGIDNDRDGLIDCEDPSCQSADDIFECVSFDSCLTDCSVEQGLCWDESDSNIFECLEQEMLCRDDCLIDPSIYNVNSCQVDVYRAFIDCSVTGQTSDGYDCLDYLCLEGDNCQGLESDPSIGLTYQSVCDA